MKKYTKFYPMLISLTAVLAGILAYGYGVPFLDIMELRTVDLRFISRGEQTPDPRIVLAVIDEKSIAREGKWIWPRSKMAKLVHELSQAGAKVIAFDIGFLEPDQSKQQVFRVIDQLKDKIRQDGTQAFFENLKKESDYDNMLAEAIRDSNAKVVLGYFFHINPEEAPGLTKEERRIHIENISGSEYKLLQLDSPEALKSLRLEAYAPQSNISEIAKQTPFSGYFNMMPDKDGVVRSIPAIIKLKNSLYPPLSLLTASIALNKNLLLHIDDVGVKSLKVGDISVPTDESGRILINYRGPGKTFPHIPVTDILNRNVNPDNLKDKIVLVGATAIAIYDLRVTPFANEFPGLEIHANIIDNILNRQILHRPDWMAIFDVMAMVFFGILLGLILPRVGAFWGFIITAAIFSSHILICQHLFQKGLVLNLVYPLVVTLVIYVGITAYRYVTESGQKKFIRDAFSYYLAPSVVKQLIESPEKLILGGEERNITAFFSDVQSFTSISEKLSPQDLVQLLNEFLTEMTDVILKYEGTVDKFEGDAIIAFFGAPNELGNHAEIACKACIDMQKRLAVLREKWKSESRPELKMRIGLCTGPAVVGNMGSKSRMDYTMMGDTVNTAARLEGVNKLYGTYIMMSESTHHAIDKDKFLTRELDAIYVVGKQIPITIYQLIGYAEDNLAREAVLQYEKGLAAYRQQQWDESAAFFNAALNLLPEDGPSRAMAERCEQFKRNPPSGWNGVFNIKDKI
jgi:adenylate cyclase